MGLVTEDGTGLATAESYGSVTDFDTYWAKRTLDVVYVAAGLGTPASVTQIEEALRITTQELDAENEANWKGDKGSSAQALDWPRNNVFDHTGFSIDSESIPTELEALTFERAARYIANVATGIIPDLTAPAGGIEREKIKAGPVEIDTSYAGAAAQSQVFPKLDSLLSFLIQFQGSVITRA